jgi:hypothetical protein
MSLTLIDYFYFNVFLGKIESGLPSFSLPAFSVQNNNTTVTFLDMCSELGVGIVVIPMIAILANVAIAKAFGKCYWLIHFTLLVKFPSQKPAVSLLLSVCLHAHALISFPFFFTNLKDSVL